MVKMAYWTNGLGEEMSSRVYAEWGCYDGYFYVVYDWRETRACGFIVMAQEDFSLMRMENPR